MNTFTHCRRNSTTAARIASLLVAMLLPCAANAFEFRPTPAEWATWSDYCKARYAISLVGKTTPYAAMVQPATAEMWKSRLGALTWESLHHHCAGVIYMQRAQVAQTDQQRMSYYRSAKSESEYTLKRIPASSPVYREVLVNVQMAQAMLGVYGTTPR